MEQRCGLHRSDCSHTGSRISNIKPRFTATYTLLAASFYSYVFFDRCTVFHPPIPDLEVQIISGKFPWKEADLESQLEELNNPPRPPWPVIPDVVWDFMERCWSPRVPRSRPSAQEVLTFSRDRLGQLLQPKYVNEMVLFSTSYP